MTYRAEIIFAFILLPFSTGIIVFYTDGNAKLNFVLVLLNILIIIFLFIINHLYVLLKVYHYKYIIGILFYIIFFTLGALRCEQYEDIQDIQYFARQPATILRIKVAEEPVSGNHVLKFNAEVLQVYFNRQLHQASGHLLVILRTDKLPLLPIKYGDIFIMPATYTEVEPPYNPAEFDFKSWLASHNIYHQIFLDPRQLIGTGENKGNRLIRFSLNLRQKQISFYRSLINDNEAFAVASTLILGYRTNLSAETLSIYSKTGTIHALSVSGMHVGIIYLLIEWALKYLSVRNIWKVIKVILTISLIWFYVVITGCSASVLRSAIMLSIFVLARLLNKNTNNYNILAFSACCLLFYNPFLLLDVGFQLSFLSVFGLIYLQPKIQWLLFFKFKWLEKVWSLIAISLAAQIMTFPFCIYYFHQFPLYFILSNIFITLPMVVLMYLGITVLLFRSIKLAYFFEKLIIFTNRGLDYIAHLPYSSLRGIWINKEELVLLCLFVAALILGLTLKNKKILLSSLLLLSGLQIYLVYDKILAVRQQKIVLFSLQKNYAIAFISSYNAIVVTDLKVTDKIFSFFIQPALDQLKVTNITCLSTKKNTNYMGLIISDHQLHYKNLSVLLVDTTFNKKRIMNMPAFDVVWIQNTPKIHLNELFHDVQFKTIWADATNKEYAIKNYQQDAAQFNRAIIVLKKNKASLINLE